MDHQHPSMTTAANESVLEYCRLDTNESRQYGVPKSHHQRSVFCKYATWSSFGHLESKLHHEAIHSAIGALLVLLLIVSYSIRFRNHPPKKNIGESASTNNESRKRRKQDFLARVGDDYGYGRSKLGYIDHWRPMEFPSLQLPLDCNVAVSSHDDGEEREVYLDYAGAGLPMKSQLEQIYQDSLSKILGNPHSTGPAAARTAEHIRIAEHRVLRHLDAVPGKYASLQLPKAFYQQSHKDKQQQFVRDQHPGYELVFTSGATRAFQTIAERFPWQSNSNRNSNSRSILVYVTNSHNSVVGMRQLAIQRGAAFHCLDLQDLEQMTTVQDWKKLEHTILRTTPNDSSILPINSSGSRHLLVFPSECNFGGDRPDAKSILKAARSSGWYTMLDIAKHASTDAVSLKDLNPDFAALSFYKLFGAPTGVGALLVRKSAISVLKESTQRQYQGGGSVDVMLPSIDYTVRRSSGLAFLQSGTSHYRGIASLVPGLDTLENLGGMSAIHKHASCLATELAMQLGNMKHQSGKPVIRLYGAWKNNHTNEPRGPTLAFNVVRSDGSVVGYNEVSKLASLNNPPIQFRTGCFCNPGACQRALELNDQQAIDNYETNGHVCGDHIDLSKNGMPTGAVRVSFGKDSLWEDLDVLVQFLQSTFQDNSPLVDNSTNRGSRIANETGNAEEKASVTKVSVSELYLFPIKSCAGLSVSEWPLSLPSGKLRYDREFAIVDTSGTALRMQTCPKLGLIAPIIDLETETMRVSAPGCQDLVVNLSDDLYHCDDGGDNVVRVCGNKCGGRVWGDAHVSEWFSSFLGIQCWLARYSSPSSNNNKRPGFSNEQPLLLVSENAVARLNQVLVHQGQTPCTAKRFRPNIVIADTLLCESHDSQHRHIEDEWKSVSLVRGKQTFTVEGDCPRCAMVDFDPTTGQKGKTLRALASYRRRNGHIVFGIFLRALATGRNANVDHNSEQDSSVWIREGDILECK